MSSYLSFFVKRDSNDVNGPDGPNNINMGGVADLVDASPNMVKIMENGIAQSRYAHNKNKNLTVIHRNMGALEDRPDAEHWQPSAETADRYWAEIVQPYFAQFQDKARYILTLWPNEPAVDVRFPGTEIIDPVATRERRKKLSQYWARMCYLARQDDRLIAVFNGSAEVRLYDKMDDFAELLDAVVRYDQWLDLHGYAPDLDDPKYAEFLYPWVPLRDRGFKGKILCGEFGQDENLLYGDQRPGYRTWMTNEQYTEQLKRAAVRLASHKVNAMVFRISFANDQDDFAQYNCNVGHAGDKRHDPDPTVWERLYWFIKNAISEVPPVDPPPVDPIPPDPEPPAPLAGNYQTTQKSNIRIAPNRNTSPAGELPIRFPVTVTQFVVGEVYEGNKYWGKIGAYYVSAQLLRKV